MEDNSGPVQIAGHSQRKIYAALRETIDLMMDPVSAARDLPRYADAAISLYSVFEANSRERIFSPWVLYQLGKNKSRFLRSRYEDWEQRRAAQANA